MDANRSPSRSHRTTSRPGRSLTVARTITMVMEWFFFRTCNDWPGVTQRKNFATRADGR